MIIEAINEETTTEPRISLRLKQVGNDVWLMCRPPGGEEFNLLLFGTIDGRLKAYSAGTPLLDPRFFHTSGNILLVV